MTLTEIQKTVSIHAPREGCDGVGCSLTAIPRAFQFTHPGRGATDLGKEIHYTAKVSIHAPREGCDISPRLSLLLSLSFNSRTPGGVRLTKSTSLHGHCRVSIHAPREGCDYTKLSDDRVKRSFNSRTPGGVRRIMTKLNATTIGFQFTHPGRGATLSAHGW